MRGLYRLSLGFVAQAKAGKITHARRYADGGGLYLKVREGGRASWVFTYARDGKVSMMGGGSVNDVSLKAAREWAAEQRLLKVKGECPLTLKREKRQAVRRSLPFKTCAERFINAFAPSWRNAKHAGQWRRTLEVYAYPTLGEKSVSLIDTADVVDVLQPLWSEKVETASRLRGRIEQILSWAAVQGLRPPNVANPARWRGHLDQVFPRKAKVKLVQHLAALPIDEVPVVWRKLVAAGDAASLACALCISTAARPGMVQKAEWDDFDLDQSLWVVPPAKMKAGREHRIALSGEAVAILDSIAPFRRRDSGLVFPSSRQQPTSLSTSTLITAFKAAGSNGATLHASSRSTFSDWVHECTHHPNEIVEMALAHSIKSQSEAAYRRGDLLQKRRAVMADWGRHLSGR
jgi:integrase